MTTGDNMYVLEMRVALLERKLAYLFQTLNIAEPQAQWGPPDPVLAGVMDLLMKGKKLDAIAYYRRETGTSLADAKRAVEAVEQGL